MAKMWEHESAREAEISPPRARPPEAKDAEEVKQALLNILDDFAAEKARLEETQLVTFNIVEDFAEEKARLEQTQLAVLNILDDASQEKASLEEAHRAVLNILDDFAAEKTRLEQTERAVLNILDDLQVEKARAVRLADDLERRAQELEAANAELESFAYSVSHDLRAPLRGLDGFSLALLEDYAPVLDDTGRRYLDFIRSSAQRMGELIDALLGLSRVTRMTMQREQVDLSELARSIAADLARQDPAREVHVRVEDGLIAEGDRQLLRVALENLLRNAWKFTAKHRRACIEVGSSDEARGRAFYVRDDGAGFDMAHTENLFMPFQRLHTEAEFPGTGIGLATVARIVRRHGGRIWAQSAIEEGATFYFTL
ncbi:MAG: hypothetical protein HYV09_13840 [Deltaproteobacteria bacterium]|nr:hypothetical protein [Deltaproteobacteria bacterium]